MLYKGERVKLHFEDGGQGRARAGSYALYYKPKNSLRYCQLDMIIVYKSIPGKGRVRMYSCGNIFHDVELPTDLEVVELDDLHESFTKSMELLDQYYLRL